jgi:hypothetical protein
MEMEAISVLYQVFLQTIAHRRFWQEMPVVYGVAAALYPRALGMEFCLA